MQSPRIETIEAKKLVGMRIETSLSENAAPALWKKFMPRRNEVCHRTNECYYSVHRYDGTPFERFTPETKFEKWAAVEVENFNTPPPDMENLTIPTGMYAVFIHKGLASTFAATTNFIFRQWMPTSGFQLDRRPHFEVMDSKYLGHENPASEEEVWIPIRS